MKQIRLRMELATRRTRRSLEQRRRRLLTELTETDRRKAAAEGDVYLLLRWREDAQRARALYEEFYDQCEALIGLLCLAAHQGVERKLEREYVERRQWFTANYGQRVRQLVAPHLTSDASDTAPALWGRRTVDAFEALYLPPSIRASLEHDNGDLIGRLMRAQEALGAWDEHLRREEGALAVPLRFH